MRSISKSATTAAEIGTNLHTMMLAEGWTLEHMDAKAQGAGTTAPAWDGTVTANTQSYGVVSYRMPEPNALERQQGITTRWVVQIELVAVGTQFDGVGINFTTATGVNADGTLVDAGTKIGILGAATSGMRMTDKPFHLGVYSHGIMLVSEFRYGYVMACERSRGVDGKLLDDIEVYSMLRHDYYNWHGLTDTLAYCGSLARSATSGEFSISKMDGTGEIGATNLTAANSLAHRGNQTGEPVGPYPTSGGKHGHPRLFSLMAKGDVAAASTQNMKLDGNIWEFKPLTNEQFIPSIGRLIIATGTQVGAAT